jgi:hypothetical protein
VLSFDRDVSRKPSEPWHLSGGIARQQQDSTQNYHHETQTQKEFPELGHGGAR